MIDYLWKNIRMEERPIPVLPVTGIKWESLFTKKSLDRCRVYCDGTLCKSGTAGKRKIPLSAL